MRDLAHVVAPANGVLSKSIERWEANYDLHVTLTAVLYRFEKSEKLRSTCRRAREPRVLRSQISTIGPAYHDLHTIIISSS